MIIFYGELKGGEVMRDKKPKSLLTVFMFCAVSLVVLLLIANGIERYRNDKREKRSVMTDVLVFTDVYYNYTTEPIKSWLKVDEEYMPTREKLNTYFKDEIKVNKKLYSDENTTIYLDNIKGNDNNFLRFNFKKEDKFERYKGDLVTIKKEVKENGRNYFSKGIVEVYDRDNKMVQNANMDIESYENENFTISLNKESLTNMNWPITFKLNLTKVNYEIKK